MAKADGYYFGLDGYFYGQEGASTKIKLCTGTENYKTIENGKRLIGKIYKGIIETGIEFEDLIELSATTYGESSVGRKKTIQKEKKVGEKIVKYNVEVDFKDSEFQAEARALACCVFNYKNKRDHDNYVKSKKVVYDPKIAQIVLDMRAYAAKDKVPNYVKFKEKSKTPEVFNKLQQYHIESGILAFIRNYQKQGKLKDIKHIPDYAYGAILWDGVDLKTNYDNHPKVNSGYFVNDEKHNVLGIKSKKITNDNGIKVLNGEQCYILNSQKDNKINEKKCYSYKYKTTAGFAKTMFVKLTDQYEEAMIHSLREEVDNTYILNPWW